LTSPEHLLDRADRCVKCGLCLPHCPTYGLSLDESESPRGRIALIQAMASGQLPDRPRLWGHIERCLGCRACERVCPSGVEYGRLLDSARALRVERRGRLRSAPGDLGLAGLTRVPAWPLFRDLLRILQRTGLLGLADRLGPAKLGRTVRLLPDLAPTHRWRPHYPAVGNERARVALLTGCVSRVVEQDALVAAVRVLTRLGVTVDVPPGQVCCGAIHMHAGRPARAARLAARNIRAFSEGEGRAVVSVASACTAQLSDYLDMTGKPVDICSFLAALDWPEGLEIAGLTGRALVHEPCTLRNASAASGSVYTLLGRIPGLAVSPLPGNDRCCGAAGTYLLTQPANADRLVQTKTRSLGAPPPRWLLSSNTGCALHLRAAATRAGLPVETLHPVQLLDRALSGQSI